MKAKDLARQVLSKFWDKTLPVNLEAIAHAMNVDVHRDPGLAWRDPDHPISGQYSFEDGRATVRVNSTDHPVRQRFTIAHELGHHCLNHGPLFRDPSKNFNISNFDSNEAAANKFAAELLMPEIAVKALIKEHGIQDVRSLAKKFGVSEVAMKYRLKNLGWNS